MKARTKENLSGDKSVPVRALSAAPGTDVRSSRKDDAKQTVATSKNYADSRLRQFCLR